MKINKTLTALIAGASLGLSGQTFAAGTAANTVIDNIATLSYTVGSTPIEEQGNVAFRVDTKVDLTLDWKDSGPKTASAGSEFALSFDIRNDGNLIQDFKFTSLDSTAGTVLPDFVAPNNTDNEQSTATFSYYLDDGAGSAGSFNKTDDTILGSDTIAASDLPLDTLTRVWVVVTLQDDSVDTARIGLQVRAQAVSGGVALNEDTATNKNLNPTNLDKNLIVFADDPAVDTGLSLSGGAIRDGGYVVLTSIEVQAAAFTVSKAVTIVSDTLSSANPRALPGSKVSYTITVTNDGRVAAQNITVTDDVNDLDGDSNPDGYYDITTVAFTEVTDVDVSGLTDTGISSNLNTGVLTVTFDEIAAGETATITFTVDIDDGI